MAVNFDHQQDRITTQSGSLSINTSGSIKIPVGNTAQRPGTVATGQIRFNTQLSRFEGYNGSAWTGLGAVADADQDTFIETDKTADDDFLRFYTVGTERVNIDNNGKLTALFDFDLTGTFDNSSNTGAMILAQGTDLQRPGTPQTGMLRFSTTSSKAEVYDGSAWVEVGTTPPVTEAFKTIAVNGQNNVVADTATDTLTFVAGTNVTITTDDTTDSITINAASTALTVQDEGVSLPTDATTLNFVGGAINVTGNGATKTITFTSGGSSADEIDDADGDTNIKVETNTDEDVIRFTTAGSERASIDATGVVKIGDSAGATFYTLPTARGTANQILKTDANGVLTFQDLTSGSGGASYQNNAPSTGLATGDLWFDTGTSAELYIYSGSEWISTAPGADTGFIKYFATGDNTTTAFNTGAGTGTVSMVFVDGDLQREGASEDYTESNGTITFASPPALNAEIDVMITGSLVTLALNPLGLANHNLIVVDSSGNVVVDSLKVSDLTDNRVVIAGSSGEIEDDANFTFDGADLKITTTSSLQIPAGTTPQRPTGATGKIRFNTQTNQFEGYNGSAWGDLGSGALAIAGDTGTDNTVVIGTDTLTFAGGTNVSTTVTNNQVEIAMSIAIDSINDTHIDFGTGANQVNTDDLPEGSNNKYFTTTGATIDTDALPQGSTNLYYTDAQVQAVSINEVVEDTSPQLGGNLESNAFEIQMADNNKIALGTGERGYLQHTGASGKVQLFSTEGGIDIRTTADDETIAISSDDGSGGIANYIIADGSTGATELYFYGSKKLETTTGGITVTGTLNTHTIPGGTGTIALTSDIPSLSGYLQNVSEDTTPQLGGNLDVNGSDIVSASSADIKIMPDGTGKVGIGESSPAEMLHVNGNIRIDGISTIATATATLSSTTETAIDTFAKATFRSCKYIVQATDTVSNEYQILEALLIHDGTTAYVTSYGIIHTGSADLFTLDADVSGANARLKATSASTNQTVYKITRITTLV